VGGGTRCAQWWCSIACFSDADDPQGTWFVSAALQFWTVSAPEK
jgi:hypothetical protein